MNGKIAYTSRNNDNIETHPNQYNFKPNTNRTKKLFNQGVLLDLNNKNKLAIRQGSMDN